MESILPTDVTIDILSRLPSESIYHCKQVCKTWLSLINHDTLFARKYRSRVYEQDDAGDSVPGKVSLVFSTASSGNLGKQFYYATYAPYERIMKYTRINLFPMDEIKTCRILGSCNGLVCISGDVEYKSYNDKHIYICNPVLKEYLRLPSLSDAAFSTIDYIVYGFGYLPCTNEYKVVKIHQVFGEAGRRVYVYTLGIGTGWRYIGKFTYGIEQTYPSVFVNGALHWVDGKQGNIVAFDLADEKFTMISLTPPCFIDNWPLKKSSSESSYQLRVLGGSLCIVHKYSDYFYDIWSLNNEGKGTQYRRWSRDYSAFEFWHHSNYPYEAGTFALTKDNEVLFFNKHSFYSHDLKQVRDNQLQYLLDFKRKISIHVREAVLHVNSFVSLKALGEEETNIFELTEVDNCGSHLIRTKKKDYDDDLSIWTEILPQKKKGFESQVESQYRQ